MISKHISGKDFRGLCDYCLGKGDLCELLTTNLGASTAADLAKAFKLVADQKRTVSKPVMHMAISFPPPERPSNDQILAIAHEYLRGVGYSRAAYAVIKHEDTNHQHFHIITSKIDLDGKTISSSHDFRRGQKVCQAIEEKFGLKKAPRTKVRHGLSTTEDVSSVIRSHIDALLKEGGVSFRNFEKTLTLEGVTLKLNRQSSGRVAGVSFGLGDQIFKGSELGGAYSWKSLTKRGLTLPEGDNVMSITEGRTIALQGMEKFESGETSERGTLDAASDLKALFGNTVLPDSKKEANAAPVTFEARTDEIRKAVAAVIRTASDGRSLEAVREKFATSYERLLKKKGDTAENFSAILTRIGQDASENRWLLEGARKMYCLLKDKRVPDSEAKKALEDFWDGLLWSQDRHAAMKSGEEHFKQAVSAKQSQGKGRYLGR